MTDCPVCQSHKANRIRNKLRYGVERDVMDCEDCGFVYLWPRMGKEETVDFYTKGEFRNIPRDKLGLQDHDCKESFNARMGQAVHRFNITKPYLNKEQRLLEIGSGPGSFLSLVQPYVRECVAMELDSVFAEYVRREFNVQVNEQAIQDLDATFGQFDVMTMWFVLEHLHDPLNDLVKLREFIKDDGLLLMLLPNLWDPLISIYRSKEYEDFFYQLPHLNYFSPTTMQDTLKRSGWKGEVKPVQIYGLANHMRWVFKKKPQAKQSKGTVEWFNVFDNVYRRWLSGTQKTDSLLVIARKDG